jgi:hypothetical protein
MNNKAKAVRRLIRMLERRAPNKDHFTYEWPSEEFITAGILHRLRECSFYLDRSGDVESVNRIQTEKVRGWLAQRKKDIANWCQPEED